MIQCCCIPGDDDGGGPGPEDGNFWPAVQCNVPNCCADNNPACPDLALFVSRTKLLSLGINMTNPPTDLCVVFEHPAFPCCRFRINWVNEPWGNQGIPWGSLPAGAIIDGITNVGSGTSPYPNCCNRTVTLTESLTCVHQFVPYYNGTSIDCESYIGEIYNKTDQWGTVQGKELTLTNTLTYCIATGGIGPGARCEEDCPPVKHEQVQIDNIVQVGLCVPVDQVASCPNQRTSVSLGFQNCEGCYPCGECCNPESDPCAGVPDTEPFCDDPKLCYTIKTCYSIVGADSYMEQVVFTAFFPWCHSGINPNSPTAYQEAVAYYTTIINVSNQQYGNAPGFPHLIDGQLLEFCDLNFHILSSSGEGIVSRIQSKMPPGVIIIGNNAPCWWFGTRQTCTTCQEPYTQRGAFSPGDRLQDVVAADISIGAGGVTVRVRGRSERYHCCVSTELNATGSDGSDYNTAGGAVIQAQTSSSPLSPVEFCLGATYNFETVKQVETLGFICTPKDDGVDVIACPYQEGFDKIAFNSRCGMAPTRKRCRSYPWNYKKACDCDPEAEPICKQVCEGIYQNAGNYCATDASPIILIRP